MSETTCHQPADARARLSDLPVSAKLVAKTLAYEGELTQSQLTEETLLSPSTVRSGLDDLEAHDLVDSRPSVVDARQRVYHITGTLES